MRFRLPTQVKIASGCIHELPDVVASYDIKRVLLVTDEGLLATPWPALAERELRNAGYQVTVEAGIEPNPRSTTVDAIAEKARKAGIQLVTGIGGGSVLDTAKAVAMLLKNEGACLQYEGKNQFKNGSVPFVAIPTTCGTGSEVTWVSVITDLANKRKFSIKGDAMFPNVALVDPELIASLPAHLVAYTGMDALTHALEAYTVICANPVSDALAEKAMGLLFTFLPRLVKDVEDAEARFEVMCASTLAGMAFGNADVGAVHCLSETIGGLWDVPHGLGNAIMLLPVMKYHESVIRERLAYLGTLLFREAGSVQEQNKAFLRALAALIDEVGIPRFESLGIPVSAFWEIAEGSVNNNSNDSNPQKMDVPAYMAILESLTT